MSNGQDIIFFLAISKERCVYTKKGKKTHYQSQPSGHGTSNDEILDDEEESMDWWTKYFASVDAMIEVIKGRFFQKVSGVNIMFRI